MLRMAAGPLTIKLRVASWGQLESIYRKDLSRSAVFLKSTNPPPIGTKVRINLTLPSETLIILGGEVAVHVPPGGLDGRGPGVDVRLQAVPQSAMWLIESALSTAQKREVSAAKKLPVASTSQALRQKAAPPTVLPRAATPTPVPVFEPSDEASLEDGASLVEAERELVAALAGELEALRPMNPFQILGVGYDAGDQQVRDAFAGLTKKYHPDRFARFESREAREHASEIFILIRDAYRQIGTEAERNRTLKALRARADAGGRTPAPVATPPAPPQKSQPITPPPPPKPPPTPPPKQSQPLSPALFDTVALPPVPQGTQPIEPQQPRTPLAGATFTNAAMLIEQGRYQEAIAVYTLVLKRTPGDRVARAGVELCEGLKSLAQRDKLEAAQRFETVLELDPTNERAARELADMRRQATNDRKGLLARLLGKKE
jgi:tetratricopeptide (TPR) repeat protein